MFDAIKMAQLKKKKSSGCDVTAGKMRNGFCGVFTIFFPVALVPPPPLSIFILLINTFFLCLLFRFCFVLLLLDAEFFKRLWHISLNRRGEM
jgi:Flp pilus assembly protein TadB